MLFTYANPVLRMDPAVFAREARDAGVDGVLMLDYPVEEAEPLRAPLVAAGLDPIFLISPTTTRWTYTAIGGTRRGFLYVISRLGVTGVRDTLADDINGLDRPRAGPVVAAGGARIWHLVARAGREGVRVRRCGRGRQRARQASSRSMARRQMSPIGRASMCDG